MPDLKKRIVSILILVTAVIMIASGLSKNEYTEVRSKAVMICRECIGIG